MINQIGITNNKTYCEKCGKKFNDGENVYIFQDEQGFDLLSGFYCGKCSEFYTEHGDHIITQACIDATNECATYGGKELKDLDDPYVKIASFLPAGIGYNDIFPKEDGETCHEWSERVQGEINIFWNDIY